MMKSGEKRTQTPRDLQLRGETTKDKSSDEFPDWAGLPEGALHVILQSLNLHDCAYFAKVCKSWRIFYNNGLLFPSRQHQAGRIIPWLVMMNRPKKTNTRRGYSIMEDVSYRIELPEDLRKSYMWGSYQDWLILLIKKDRKILLCQQSLVDAGILLWQQSIVNAEIYLFNPFSTTRIDLPKFTGSYKRLVLSSSPCDENCVFMLFSSRWVGVWISGARTWRYFKLPELLQYEDAVFCQGQFYLVSKDCKMVAIDVQNVVSATKNGKDSAISEIRARYLAIKMLDSPKSNTTTSLCLRRHLVRSCNEVLLVCQNVVGSDPTRMSRKAPYAGVNAGSPLHWSETCSFDIYKLDNCDGKAEWTKLKSLGDRVVFIGNSSCRCYSVEELGCGIGRPNHVYFTQGESYPYWRWRPTIDFKRATHIDDWGVFNLEEDNQPAKNFARRKPASRGPIWLSAPTWWYKKQYVDAKLNGQEDVADQ